MGCLAPSSVGGLGRRRRRRQSGLPGHPLHVAHKQRLPTFLSCATGQHIKKAILTVRKSGAEQQQDYYKVTLEDILVSSYQQGSPEGGDANQDTLPVDSFSLDFATIELDYVVIGPDGKPGESFKAGYDLKQNKKV